MFKFFRPPFTELGVEEQFRDFARKFPPGEPPFIEIESEYEIIRAIQKHLREFQPVVNFSPGGKQKNKIKLLRKPKRKARKAPGLDFYFNEHTIKHALELVREIKKTFL